MKEQSLKKKRIFSITAIVILLILWGVIFYFAGKPMLEFLDEPEKFRLWVDEKGILGKLAFIGMVFLQVIVAIIPGEPLEIAAGYAFGAVEGTLLCIIGILLGSLAIFLAVKKWGVKLVELFISLEKINSLKFLQNEKRFFILFFIIYALPGTPKDVLTYFAPLSKIKMGQWLFICTVGRLPSLITSTIGGNALGVSDYSFALIILALTLVLSAAGFFIYKAYMKKHGK